LRATIPLALGAAVLTSRSRSISAAGVDDEGDSWCHLVAVLA
jgi:hypothetical protein